MPDDAAPEHGRNEQLHALGAFIRAQRRLANLSLRQMADLAHVGRALDLSAETLLAQAGLLDPDVDGDGEAPSTEAAIRRDSQLTDDQKQALLVVYRSYVDLGVKLRKLV